jgi:tetraacyldisaccharide 4'-kinase
VRTAPAFWWRREPGLQAKLLSPLSRLVGSSATMRMNRAPTFRAPLPVICVGNFVVGGAGKTPTSLALASLARSAGLKPGFLASGYGGSAEGPRLVDRTTDVPALVGDEALLLAESAPTVIGRDRVAAAKRLIEAGIDLIIMDDGLQNPGLAKDLVLGVVDAGAGIGNGMVLPAGPLRAPLGPQLLRVSAIVLVGDGEAAEPVIRAAARAGRATLRARLKPALRGHDWSGQPVLAYAGIGRPEKFFASLAEVGAPIAARVAFPDHHRFSEAEAARLVAHAEAADLRLVTTAKDLVRLKGEGGALAALREKSVALPITLEFDNPETVAEMIDGAARNRPAAA